MNKSKANGLIKKLNEINKLTFEVEKELNFENLLGYIQDYTSITIKELRKRYHIKEPKT